MSYGARFAAQLKDFKVVFFLQGALLDRFRREVKEKIYESDAGAAGMIHSAILSITSVSMPLNP
jgi:hypothetical protein